MISQISTAAGRGIITLSIVVLVNACASTPPFQPASAKPDAALLYLYRPSSIVGSGNDYLAAVNGRVVARMKSGSYFQLDQPPGKVVISLKIARPWWAPVIITIAGALTDDFNKTDEFEVRSGQKYFVHFPRGKLTTNESEALKDMAGLELIPGPE